MSKIQEFLDAIKNARYGKEVRQAIHDAIHQCYEDGKAGDIDLIARESIEAIREDVSALDSRAGTIETTQTELAEQVGLMDIKKTTARTIQGTKHGGYRLTKMVGNTIQNGTPTVDNPSPLLSTGDCVELINGMYYYLTGAYSHANDSVCVKEPIPCKGGDLLKIKTDSSCTQCVVFLNNGAYLSNSTVHAVTEREHTVPSGATHFVFSTVCGVNVTPQTAGKITIQINGKYVNCVKTRLKVEMIQGTLINGVLTDSTTRVNSKNYTSCKSGDVIEIATRELNQILAISYYDDNGAYVNGASGENIYKFSATVPVGATKFKFVVGRSANVTPETVGEITLKINGIGETIAYYYTDYPMIKGSTLFRENGLVKVMHTEKEITLDCSNVSIGLNKVGEKSIEALANVTDKAYGISNIISDMFVPVGAYTDTVGCTRGYANANQFCFTIPIEYNTVTLCKQWVTENKPTFQYELATPIIETLDTASQIALNSLETFDGVTIVEEDSRVPSLEIEGEVGTSQVGAYTLKALNNSESNAVKIEDAVSTMLLLT